MNEINAAYDAIKMVRHILRADPQAAITVPVATTGTAMAVGTAGAGIGGHGISSKVIRTSTNLPNVKRPQISSTVDITKKH